MSPIIEVKHLSKQFGAFKAVDDISFNVERGELFGFLGVNGAGKSTTINMLCTLFQKSQGVVKVCAHLLGEENDAIRKKIGVVFQENTLDGKLSVKQNLLLRAYLYENNTQKVKEALEMVSGVLQIGDLLQRPFRELSGGQKRRCEIGRALMNRPELLFLDEPTTGLDPQTRQLVWESIAYLRKHYGMTIFLTTHYMEEAAKAEHIAIMDRGKIVASGTPFELKETYATDKMRLSPLELEKEKVIEIIGKHKLKYRHTTNALEVELAYSMCAIPLLNELAGSISSFEVVQGTMEDAFLKITGKSLREA